VKLFGKNSLFRKSGNYREGCGIKIPTDLDESLTVLSPCFRPSYGARIEILREACVSQAGQPLSTVESGRDGLPPAQAIPAVYIAGRDLNLNPTANTAELGGAPLHTTGRLTMHCS
jgi:hypothetical protein